MAEESDITDKPDKKDIEQKARVKLTELGELVDGYAQAAKQKFYDLTHREPSPDGKNHHKVDMSVVEERVIQTVTGVPIAAHAKLYVVPTGIKNPVLVEYEAKKKTILGGFHPEAEVGLGLHTPTIDKAGFIREQADMDGKPGTYQEFGLLEPHEGRGPALLGNVNPKTPVLADELRVADVGTNGGLGYRETRTVNAGILGDVTLQTQIAEMPHMPVTLTDQKMAPRSTVSVSKTGEIGEGNHYLAGVTAFTGNIGSAITRMDHVSGVDVTLAGQHKFGDDKTLNLTLEFAEAEKQRLAAAGAEFSKQYENFTLYTRAQHTDTQGHTLGTGIAPGHVTEADIGIAKDLGKKLRVFCEAGHSTASKVVVQCGFHGAAFGGVLSNRKRD